MDLSPETALFLYNSGACAHEDARLMIQDLYLTWRRYSSACLATVSPSGLKSNTSTEIQCRYPPCRKVRMTILCWRYM